MTIVRSFDSSCNAKKAITTNGHKNDKPKRKKNEKSVFAIEKSMVKQLNGWEMSKKCKL